MKGRLEHECRSKGGKVHTEEKEEHKAKKRKRGGKVHGEASPHRLDKRARGGSHFIQGMHLKKGALHKQLGVPESEKIPEKKLKAAASGKYGAKAEKRAHTAEMLKGLHH